MLSYHNENQGKKEGKTMKRCQVVIAEGIACGAEAVKTYKCVIEVKDGKEIHKVNVCKKHRRHFDENNL
jgi:hypothetical protein